MISVVIATMGNMNYLNRSLTSVKNQTYKDIEVVIVDGKDDKKVNDLLVSFNFPKHIYVGLKEDHGVMFSRNVGCEKSNGEYIAMLDDDDEWLPQKLEKQIQYFDNRTGIVTSYTKVICDDDVRLNTDITPKDRPSYAYLLSGFHVSPTSSFLVKKDIFKSVDYFSKILIYPEYDLALRILKKGYDIRCVPEFLLIYHKIAKQKRQYSKKTINSIRVIELINFIRRYDKDFSKYLKGRAFIYNILRIFVLFVVLGFGGIFNQNSELFLEKLKYFMENRVDQ